MKLLQVATLSMLLGLAGTAIAATEQPAAQSPEDQQQQEQQTQEQGSAAKQPRGQRHQ